LPTDSAPEPGHDVGLLSPVTAGRDALVSDAAYLRALVQAEIALVKALGSVGLAPPATMDAVLTAIGKAEIDPAVLALEAVGDGNPVIPLVKRLRALVADVPGGAAWVHHGATSQDIVDTAIAILAQQAIQRIGQQLDRVVAALADRAERYRDLPAAGRTLTQHAVPTTVGARFADWLVQVADARQGLAGAVLPAQLGGAGGTLAALVEEFGAARTAKVAVAYAAAAKLPLAETPYHVRRDGITRLGDALVRVLDALGRIGTEIATLSRTEIGEIAEPTGGTSSAMPQKQNPVRSVLLRSAALRGPGLASTLHLAAALTVDERPDGAWHAEWPTLRELLRLGLGVSAIAAELAEGLAVDEAAVARNLAAGGGTILAERVMLVLAPKLGRDAVQAIVSEASEERPLRSLLAERASLGEAELDALLDPGGYLGIAGALVDRALARARGGKETP